MFHYYHNINPERLIEWQYCSGWEREVDSSPPWAPLPGQFFWSCGKDRGILGSTGRWERASWSAWTSPGQILLQDKEQGQSDWFGWEGTEKCSTGFLIAFFRPNWHNLQMFIISISAAVFCSQTFFTCFRFTQEMTPLCPPLSFFLNKQLITLCEE